MYRSNLKRHWREHLTHVGVAGFAGWLLTLPGLQAAGAVIMATVWVRQGLEFAKRRDTPGIDLAYHLGGLLAGVGIGLYLMRRLKMRRSRARQAYEEAVAAIVAAATAEEETTYDVEADQARERARARLQASRRVIAQEESDG